MRGFIFLLGFLLFIWLICAFFAERGRMERRNLPNQKSKIANPQLSIPLSP